MGHFSFKGDIGVIERIDRYIYTRVPSYNEGLYLLKASEIKLCILDNALNRKLYPDRNEKDGYLVPRNLK